MSASPCTPYTPMDEIGMSTRLSNCCREEGVRTLGQFAARTRREWLLTPNLGKSTFSEVERILASVGMHVGMSAAEIIKMESETVNLYELHERMTAHLFPTYSSTDERFLALALCGEAGELANLIKKRWRDGVDLRDEIKDEIADIRIYLELLAKCFGIEGDKLDQQVKDKLVKVVEKHRARLAT